jgi:hypothetical protein
MQQPPLPPPHSPPPPPPPPPPLPLVITPLSIAPGGALLGCATRFRFTTPPPYSLHRPSLTLRSSTIRRLQLLIEFQSLSCHQPPLPLHVIERLSLIAPFITRPLLLLPPPLSPRPAAPYLHMPTHALWLARETKCNLLWQNIFTEFPEACRSSQPTYHPSELAAEKRFYIQSQVRGAGAMQRADCADGRFRAQVRLVFITLSL